MLLAGMADLDARFSAAAASVKTFTATKPVPNESKLAVYGLYKQATGGDVSTPRPGEFCAVNFVAILLFQCAFLLRPARVKLRSLTTAPSSLAAAVASSSGQGGSLSC